MKQSSKTALGGIIAALSTALMFMTGLIPFLTYALPALAGSLLAVAVIEINKKWAFFIYLSVSILSFFVVPDKEAAMIYTAFFGYYPILKQLLESRASRVVEWILKLLIFNFSAVASYAVIINIFGIPLEELAQYGKYGVIVLLAAADVMFLLYDYCLSRMIADYLNKWRFRFKSLFR